MKNDNKEIKQGGRGYFVKQLMVNLGKVIYTILRNIKE